VAELLYPTNVELEGPWLIPSNQLEALDKIVDGQVPFLEASIERRLLEEIANQLSGRSEEEKAKWLAERRKSYLFQLKREVNIQLADGKEISSKSFREAIALPEVTYSRIVGFSMELENGEARSRIRAGRNLQISVSGNNSQEREVLFTALRQWTNDIQAPSWQRAWLWMTDQGLQWA
jgi:hypothetical protein